MGRPFRGTRAGVRVQLPLEEREVLARFLADVAGLLARPEPGTDGDPDGGPDGDPDGDPDRSADPLAALEAAVRVTPPRDPAVLRLLPDGSRDDPEVAQSYRRLTEPTLRERKTAALELAGRALVRPDPVVLDPAEAQALLKGLTDVRLVIAERLGLRTDEDVELLHAALASGGDAGPGVELVRAAAVYDALSWWQESLVSALRR
jgi:hypothetical protein